MKYLDSIYCIQLSASDMFAPEIFEALNLTEFVAIDIETTGLDYQKEDIIEFGGIHFKNGKAVRKTNFLIKPTRPIPEQITRITGISEADVQTVSPFSQQCDQILQFVGDLPIVAHNINFDLPFLEYHTRKARGDFVDWEGRIKEYRYFSNEKFDTMVLARIFLPFLPSFGLATLARYFQIKGGQAHRALSDASKAGQIFLNLLEIAVRMKFADVQKLLKILHPTDDPISDFFQRLAVFLSQSGYQTMEGIDRESFTVSANFFNIIGEGDSFPPGRLETRPIDENEVGAFFETQGPLAREFGSFEIRPQQKKMAVAIAEAFNESKFLVVEAGTGTGKSLAYLLPALSWAMENYGPNGRVIISTNTKNLQEQLFFKDLPILHSILKKPFKAVLLKGKSNYLCLDKWVTVMNDMDSRLSVDDRSRLLPLYLWVQQTETGDISENNGFNVERNYGLWSKLIAENNYCPGRNCKHYKDCFLMRARNNAKDAHLVFVNHSLLFSDLATEQAILSDYVNVIFDEAHNIEKTATEYMGIDINPWQFRDFYNKLYRKETIETGILIQLKKRLQLSKLPSAHVKSLMKMIDGLLKKVPSTWKKTQTFFKELSALLKEKIPQTNENFNSRFRYGKGDDLFSDLGPYYLELVSEFKKLQSDLNDLIEYFKDIPEGSFEYQRQLFQELNAQFMQADLLVNNLQFLIAAEWDNYVYWFELPSRPDSFDVRLYAAPLDVASILHERLYKKLNTAIFTSATIAVNKQFDYFINRVGLNFLPEERLNTLLLDSPFNYDEQVLLTIPSYFPDPKHPEFQPHVKQFIEKLVTTLPRGTLVLFTSYAMLNNIYRAVKLTFSAENVLLLGQGLDGSRHSLINRFKSDEKSFLMGTDSFWEGIDVPGKALEILLITKLPFDVPSEPIIQAKAELIKKRGGNPFMDYTVPEAVIRFRQGFGRLIRSRNDYGAIIILDTRVIKKLYGRIFLQSLPLKAKIFSDETELWQAVQRWFGSEVKELH